MGIFFIAEIGVNHEGSINLALDMVRNAKLAGADAVKFQTYKSSSLAAANSPSYWDLDSEPCTSQRDLFNKHECFEFKFYEPIIKLCQELDIVFLTTCFDKDLVDIFDPFLSLYKISSSDLTNYELIYHICKKNKPIILSCGASTLDEIRETCSFIRSNNNQQLTLLHCVLNYPCPPENANLKMIRTLQDFLFQIRLVILVLYQCLASACMNAAVCLGASVIESILLNADCAQATIIIMLLQQKIYTYLDKIAFPTRQLGSEFLILIRSQKPLLMLVDLYITLKI